MKKASNVAKPHPGLSLVLKVSPLFLLGCLVSSCMLLALKGQLPLESTPEIEEEGEEDYRINVQDALSITVYPDADLNTEVRVSNEGKIQFPLVGYVHVAGLSVEEVEKKMIALLERDYLVSPQVHVRVNQFHSLSVYLLGEVGRPGAYELDEQTTLLEAIAKSGGFAPVANMKKIKIVRTEDGKKKTYKVNAEEIMKGKKKDVKLQANDIVIVPQSLF